MANKFTDFLKNNKANAAFAALDLPAAVSGEHKLKGMLALITNLALGTQVWNYQLGKLFAGMGSAVKGMITSTGSLYAAMKKLGDTQAAQKSFTALGVSASGARAEIQKLAKMSAAKGMDFREVSEATQNLLSLSRGAKGTASDMEELIDVSKATGASLQDLASNVGEVSAAMRNGDAIDGAIDRLRAIGAISDSSATSLKNLQKAGAGALTIDRGVSGAMRKSASSGPGAGILQASQDRESASTGLKEAVGKPWVEGDVETTKNYTEALKAITPALAGISEFFAQIFARTGAWTSWLVKTIAAIPGLGMALKGVTVLLTMFAAVVTVVANIKLAQWLIGSTSLFGRMAAGIKTAASAIFLFTGSARAATVAAYAMSAAINITRGALILLQAASVFLIGFAIIGQIFTALTGDTAALAKEMDDAARSSKEFNDELMLQANNIETLADKHALLQKAIKASSDAWAAVAEQQKANDDEWFYVSNEGKQKLARKTADAKAIDDSKAKIASAPISKTEIMRHKVEKKLSEEQTARDIEMSKASPKEKVELTKRESKRLAGLAADGEKEIKLGKEAEEKITAIEYERSLAIKEDAAKGKPAERAARVERAKAGLAEANSAGPIDAWNRKEKVAAAQKELDAANAAVEKGVGGKFDDKIIKLLESSDSDILKGQGMQRRVIERRKTANLSVNEREQLSLEHTEGQRLIDKGTKAKNETLQNKAASKAAAEEARKGKIADKYANLEADAQADLASSMSEGHQAFMQQSNAKLASIDREIEAYKELHKGVDATNDAYLKNRANAKAAELVAQKFEAQKHEADQRQLVAREKAAADESVGMTRQANERAAAVEEAMDAYEQEREIQEELKAQDEDNTGTVGYKNQANDTKLRGLMANFNEAYIARNEGDKQDKLTVDSMNRDIASNQAAADGDSETVKMNEAADNLQAKAMEFRSKGMDPKAAAIAAQRYVRNSVEIQAGQDSRSAAQSAAVSSLAAIGAGGGVESVDTQIDLTKRLVDLNKRANELLTIISGQESDIPIQ